MSEGCAAPSSVSDVPAGASPELLDRLRHELESPPFNAWLSPVAEQAGTSGTTIRLTYRPELGYRPSEAIFHGGVIAALIDIAAYASVAILREHATPTAALAIDFLAPAVGRELVARTRLRKVGRSLARVDVDVFAGDRLVVLGRGTFSTGGLNR